MSDFRPLRDGEIENIRAAMDADTPAYIILVQDKEGGSISFSRNGPMANIVGMLEIARTRILNEIITDEDDDED